MQKEFKLPDLGEGLHEAVLVDWKVKEGDTVKAEQVLAEVETDKALSELPSPYAGKIIKLHGKPGDTLTVGAAVVTFDVSETAAPSRAGAAKSDGAKTEKVPARAAQTIPKSEEAKAIPTETSRRPVLAAPATRRLARERGINLELVHGTGPGGRITPEDVLSYASSPEGRQGRPSAEPAEEMASSEGALAFPRPVLPDFSLWGEVERHQATAIRRRIAQRMTLASHTAASVTHMDEADVTALEEGRLNLRAVAEKKGIRLTLLPFAIKAVVAALQHRSIFNASYDEDKQEIVIKKYFHIGVAVDSPQGLLVPVVRNADKKTLPELARDIVTLAEKAREGKLKADEMRGGSFTITNIGAIGGLMFTPILNWPEVAILGLGRLQERPIVKNGAVVVRKMLPIILTFDHRLTDGADAAHFVNDVKAYLENPLRITLEI